MRVVGPPVQPKIYHITHLDNLPSIVADGCVWSERKVLERKSSNMCIGMDSIKKRRLYEIEVSCHPGTMVGDYAPFYFCPRSVMLYIIHKRNHPNLAYNDGQGPVLHFTADLHTVVKWAEQNAISWAFTTSNAGAYYVDFHRNLGELGEVKWTAVAARDWHAPDVKEGKQAEFLVYERLPLELIEHIGVISSQVENAVKQVLSGSSHQPPVTIEPAWYY